MGHHNHHFSGDPYAHSGVWGSPTSAANFCEEDYAVTTYIAEFVNAFTNLAYVYFALRFPGRPVGKPWYQLDFMSWSLFLVGVCSLIYHATLLQTCQYSDDLSMFLLTGALLQALYTTSQTPAVKYAISTIIALCIGTISYLYVRSGSLLFHSTAFGTFLTFIWPRTLFLIYRPDRPKAEASRRMKRFMRAVVWLTLAFILWNIDLEYCFNLRDIRHKIGLPWAWLLEFHGWWHILTAVGASEYIKLTRELTLASPTRG